jgi:hypothetical protein
MNGTMMREKGIGKDEEQNGCSLFSGTIPALPAKAKETTHTKKKNYHDNL